MTPVTDEYLKSLMKGVEAREKRAMKRLVAASENLSRHSGCATAKVIAFERSAPSQSTRNQVPADVIVLETEKKALSRRKTSHGRFVAFVPKSSA